MIAPTTEQDPGLLVPDAGESEERFVIRAHRALLDRVPDPDERNSLIWAAWDAMHGPSTAALIAARTFGNAKYTHAENICEFAEHETQKADGTQKRYDLGEMVRITRTCNERIVDCDAFAPLVDGHTPNPDDLDQTDPPVVGYAGPYRLGMLGRLRPRWGIFADEWHYREQAAEIARKPRRSVELWTFDNDPAHSHFDPIAVLGAEAPRLALPVRYRAETMSGVHVTRYSAPAFASPGASNTFVRQPVKGARATTDRYATDSSSIPGGSSMPLSQDDIGQLLGALAETPQFKFLDQLMAQQAGGAPTGEPDGDELGGGDDDLNDVADMLVDDDGGGEGFEEGGDEGGEPPVVEDDEPEEKNNPAAMAALAGGGLRAGLGRAAGAVASKLTPAALGAGAKAVAPHALLGASGYMGARAGSRSQNSRRGAGDLAAKYSRLKSSHNKLVQEHGRLANRMISLERDKTDAERVAALQGVAARFPDFLDLDAEYSVTLYSRGAQMNDEAFKGHVAQVEKYAHRASMVARSTAGGIPLGELPSASMPTAEADKYSARLTKEAVRIHTEAVNAGKDGYTWEQARSAAEKNLAGRG